MTVILPPWADGMLDLAGMPWPNVNEHEMRKDAQAWRTVQAGILPAAAAADTTVRKVADHYTGASATALANHWQQAGGTGQLHQAESAAKSAPMVLDGAADVVTATKVAVVAQAGVAATKLAAIMLPGGPLAAGAAVGTVLAARLAIGKILREAGEGGAKVLAPALLRKVTEPLERIAARGTPGRVPALEAASGRAHVPVNPHTAPRPTGGHDIGRPDTMAMARRGITDADVEDALAKPYRTTRGPAGSSDIEGHNGVVVRQKSDGEVGTAYWGDDGYGDHRAPKS